MKKENSNNELKKMIIFFTISLGIIFSLIFIFRLLRINKEKSNNIQNFQYQQEIQQYRDENASLYADQTGDPLEVSNEDESPSQVFILNSEFWADTNFSQYQILAFLPIVEQYLILNTDISRWHIHLSEFHDSQMAPYFFITIEELPEKKIKCVWNERKQGYAFIEIR